jgi:Uma2 family endonuclease
MGMAQLVERYWTAEEVRALPEDGNRYECIDGVLLVTPAPVYDHNHAIGGLYLRLRAFVERCTLGKVLFAPADVEIARGTMVQPDLFVATSGTGDTVRSSEDIGSLLLAVEVVSPSSARVDRDLKRRLYQRIGVHEYWIVDLARRQVERWTPHSQVAEVLSSGLAWSPLGALEPLEIDLERFFAEVLDD